MAASKPVVMNEYHYATVKTIAPLTVQMDGSATPISAKKLVAVAVNDYVAVLCKGREVLVLGKPT